jgi:hypothetical protein
MSFCGIVNCHTLIYLQRILFYQISENNETITRSSPAGGKYITCTAHFSLIILKIHVMYIS